MISDAQIISFQQLYKKHFGREISREEALKNAIQLMRTVELTYKPMTEDDFKKLQARHI